MDGILDMVSNTPTWQVHAVLFLLILASGLCLFAEDLAVVAAGVLASRGVIEFVPTVILCVTAVIVADSILFLLGRTLGEGALKKPFFRRLVSPGRLERARRMARRQGHRLVLVTRFLPGFRAPLYFTCGTLGITVPRFLLFDALAASIEVTLLLLAANWAGGKIGGLENLLAGIEYVLPAAALAVLLGMILRRAIFRRRTIPARPLPDHPADGVQAGTLAAR